MFYKSSLHSVNDMRTKWQQNIKGTQAMAEEIKSVIARSRDTIVADALGVAALMVMLVVGLALPGLI